MRIQSVEISNFRCIEHVEVDFDDITTLIGPNGCGKSTILKALDWFFNADRGALTEEDVYQGWKGERKVRVRVTFGDLTEADRSMLTAKYAPDSRSTFTAWRTWEQGDDKFTGKAMAFGPFEEVRWAQGAAARKQALKLVRDANPELGIPTWTNQADTMAALDRWEAEHPEMLTDAEVSDTHFFGFQANNRLSGIFDFVFVTADLRAAEESIDARGAVVGRLLSLAVDRTGVDSELQKLAEDVARRQAAITEDHIADQLADVATQIAAEMEPFAARRRIQLDPEVVAPRMSPFRIGVKVIDDPFVTSVDRQGHGLQRTLLISTLKLLAERGARDPSGSVVCLGIEEPELFQHPTQARLFSSVLRQLAERSHSRVQIAYATHSPYFIEPRFFDQIRLIRRDGDRAGVPVVTVGQASMEKVAARLAAHRALDALRSRWDQVCLKNLAEAFFADAVVLVEGDHDKAVIEGAAMRTRSFEYDGIVVAVANGKNGMPIPHAILSELGIPTLSVFDNDSGVADRMRESGKEDGDIEQAVRSVRRENRELLTYFGVELTDYPAGKVCDRLMVTPDTIESVLASDWPDWDSTRNKLIDDQRGVKGKNAATYRLACEECTADPTGYIVSCVEAARELVAEVRQPSLSRPHSDSSA